jgi:hypothetical protein
MFVSTMEGGMNMGMPDVCKTPVGPVITPIPYPNISTGVMANPGTCAMTVLTSAMPSVTQITEIMLSQGDDPGVLMGVVSNMVMGPTEHLLGAPTVLFEGTPVQHLTTMTGHNGMAMNCPGTTLAPSQVTVMALG